MSVNDYLINNVKDLILGFGWNDLGPQKNPVMFSYQHEETKDRLNLYYTTMTVTLQGKGSRFPKTWKNVSIEQLESILQSGDINQELFK